MGEEREGERPRDQVREGGREERVVHHGRRGDGERRRKRARRLRALGHEEDERREGADCKMEKQEHVHHQTPAAPPQRQKQGPVAPLGQRPAARRVRLGDEQERGGVDAEVAIVGAQLVDRAAEAAQHAAHAKLAQALQSVLARRPARGAIEHRHFQCVATRSFYTSIPII